MIGVTVSRWSMAYFGTAVLSFLLAQGLMAAGVAYPRAGLLAPATLATVHLITIGWLTVLILGALHQFVPVIAERPLTSQRLSAWSLVLIVAGLAGMITGFLQLEPAAAEETAGLPWLPVGGAVVVIGVLLAAFNIGSVLARSRPLSLPSRFVATGLAFLVLTVSMGVIMALVLTRPSITRFVDTVPLLTHGLPLHLVAGVGGWFTLTAMGVAYKLLAMFTLAPEHRGAVGQWVFRLTAGGLVLVAVGGLVRSFAGSQAPALLNGLMGLGWAAALAGAALYLWDMRRLYRQRSRAKLELNARFGAVALAAMGVGVAAMVVAGALGRAAAGAPVLSYVFIFGWLSGLGLTQLYKIVPFLTWLERFGPRLGTGPVPRVQDLVNERRAQPWFVLYFAAVALGAVSGFAGWTAVWQAAFAVSGLATLLITRELWRARTFRIPG